MKAASLHQRTLSAVVSAHVMLLVVVMGYHLVAAKRDLEPVAMRVRLVSLPRPGGGGAKAEASGEEAPPPAPVPVEPPAPRPPPREPPAPVAKAVQVPPPEPVVAPVKPAAAPVVETSQQTRKPAKVVAAQPEPKKTPEPVARIRPASPKSKVPVNLAAKAPPKPVYRSPDEILRSWKQKHPSPVAAPRPQLQPVAKADASQIAANISKRAGHNLRAGVMASAGTDGGAPGPGRDGSADGASAQYYDAVSDVLHGRWVQPSRAEVGKGQPTVTVSITVLADGHVTLARVLTSSGVSAMDNSVSRVLKALDRLPPFTDYGLKGKSLEFTVVFELD